MTEPAAPQSAASIFKNIRGPAAGWIGAVAITLSAAGGLTAVSEGKVNHAYVDLLARARPITECYGHTGDDVKLGDVKTDEQCGTLLKSDIVKHATGIAPALKRDISLKSFSGFADFSVNLGVARFNASSIPVDWNAGRYQQACDDILKYKLSGGEDCFAHGSKCPGIRIRRLAERRLCVEGLT